jgi:hypothetical protein
VGRQEFVAEVAARVKPRSRRVRLEMKEGVDGVWSVREAPCAYGREGTKSGGRALQTVFGAENRF